MHEKLNYKNFLDISKSIAGDLFLKHTYPWEVLKEIKNFVLNLGNELPKNEYEEIKKSVWVSKDCSIFDSAFIQGPTIIQKNAQIRHCAFIRGSVIIGENSVVGNSTEIKNSILFDNVQVPHFNYIGDSVLGYRSHFGAGSITSNVKSDRSDIKVLFSGEKIDTKIYKFGAIVGDYTEIGCNAVLNPGTIIGRGCTVYPTSMVRGILEENMIFKSQNNIVKKRL